jgi:hypothetical protein
MNDPRKVNLNGMEMTVRWHEYNNGRKAIELLCPCDPEEREYYPDGLERWTTASVNLVDVEIGPNQVAIKNYSENAGVLKALQAAGIVGAPTFYASTNFVNIPVCPIIEYDAEQAADDAAAAAEAEDYYKRYGHDDCEPDDGYIGCGFDAAGLASAGFGTDEDYGYYGDDECW